MHVQKRKKKEAGRNQRKKERRETHLTKKRKRRGNGMVGPIWRELSETGWKRLNWLKLSTNLTKKPVERKKLQGLIVWIIGMKNAKSI